MSEPLWKKVTKRCEICSAPLVLKNARDLTRKSTCSKECRGKRNMRLRDAEQIQAAMALGHSAKNRQKAAKTTSEKMQLGLIPKPPRRPRRPDKFCSICNKKIWINSIGDKCRTCFNKAKTNGKIIPCAQCQKLLYRPPNRRKQNNQFCSSACWYTWRKQQPSIKVIEVCAECDRDFMRFPSQPGKYCSRACAWRNAPRGQDAAAYIDGRTPFRKLIKTCAAYNQWRTDIFIRDKWRCVECGNTETLHAHHIRSFSQLLSDFVEAHPNVDLKVDKEEAVRLALDFDPFWDIENGTTLCVNCHALKHPDINFDYS